MASIKNNNKLKDYFYINNNNDEDLKRNENEATTKLKIKIKKSLNNNNNVNTPIRPTTASVIITPRDTEDIKKSNLKKMYFFRF